MSLINQVLNDLERRGAAHPLAGEAVRVVPAARAFPWRPLALGAAGLVLLVLAWVWYRHEQATAVVAAPTGAAAPVSAPPVAMMPSVPTSAVPVAVPESQEERPAPASRLSFELSSIPLPVTAREPVRDESPRKAVSQAAPSRPVTEPPREQAALQPPVVSKQLKKLTPSQQAELEFRRGNEALLSGRPDEAMAAYQSALVIDPRHERARQAVVGMLLRAKRNQEAETLLEEGLRLNRRQASFAMLLARLQVERNAVPQALATLEETLAYAEVTPDYHAFLAALLQRQERHREAVNHYRLALQAEPTMAVWLMGLGISLEALQRSAEARVAYQRALDSQTLDKELQAFVSQKLQALAAR